MKTNTRTTTKRVVSPTGVNTLASRPTDELRRTVLNCLLFEDTFYEGADSMAKRIKDLVLTSPASATALLADEARNQLGLRHVSLYITACLAKKVTGDSLVSKTIESVVKRADELSEFLALYWKLNNRDAKSTKAKKISSQVKKGLAAAFLNFNEYQLAKYNRDNDIKLIDVMRLVHPKPESQEQIATLNALATGTLAIPDTWEVALSSGADKKATWERLLSEDKLGPLALLRNLRNMQQATVNKQLIAKAMYRVKWDKARIFPFQFINAVNTVPELADEINAALIQAVAGVVYKVPGRTLLVVDVSGSMRGNLSKKGMADRIDAAAALAIGLRSCCEYVTTYVTAGNDHSQVHKTARLSGALAGTELLDGIRSGYNKMGGGGIFLTQCMTHIQNELGQNFDRVIVFTDEQDCDRDAARNMNKAPKLAPYNYIMNVGGYKTGLHEDAGWTKINGFSERLPEWIIATEA